MIDMKGWSCSLCWSVLSSCFIFRPGTSEKREGGGVILEDSHLFHLVKVLFYFFDATKELEIGGKPQSGSCRLCDVFVVSVYIWRQ